MTKDQFYKAHLNRQAIYVLIAAIALSCAQWYPLIATTLSILSLLMAIRSIRNYDRDWAKQESQNRFDHGCKVGPYETPNE